MPPTSTVISGAVSVEHVRPIHQRFSGRHLLAGSEVVAEPVGGRFEHGERFHVGLLLVVSVRPGANGTVMSCPASFAASRRPRTRRGRSGRRARPRSAGCELLNSAGSLEGLQHFGEVGGLVDVPVLLRREAETGTVGPAALVGAAEGAADAHAVVTSCEMVSPDPRILALRAVTSASPIRSWSTAGRGPATAAAPGPTGRGSATRGPCRGAGACTSLGERVGELSGFSWKRLEIGA